MGKMNLKKGKAKYVGMFNKLVVIDLEENKTYITKVLGVDEMERGKVVSHLYDVLNGIDISDTKRYSVHFIQPNIFGFGGTKIKPLYLEEGWKNNEEDE